MQHDPLHYLLFDRSEGDDGVTTLEAVASTRAESHVAAMAEVQRVLDWAQTHFAGRQGPIEDGMDWQHELLLQQEEGGWCTLTLTLAGSAAFVDAFTAHFGDPEAAAGS